MVLVMTHKMSRLLAGNLTSSLQLLDPDGAPIVFLMKIRHCRRHFIKCLLILPDLHLHLVLFLIAARNSALVGDLDLPPFDVDLTPFCDVRGVDDDLLGGDSLCFDS